MARLHGLPWRGSPAPRILILGSFPSAASLSLGRYYGNERNHFWSLLGAALAAGEGPGSPGFPEDYEGRMERLVEEGIALWDVIASCEREGSLDADIRGEEPNPLLDFIASRPAIVRVALNGGKAAESFRRHAAPELPTVALPIGRPREWKPPSLGGRAILVCRLPSSSPIPTRDCRDAADKAGTWKAFLSGTGI